MRPPVYRNPVMPLLLAPFVLILTVVLFIQYLQSHDEWLLVTGIIVMAGLILDGFIYWLIYFRRR